LTQLTTNVNLAAAVTTGYIALYGVVYKLCHTIIILNDCCWPPSFYPGPATAEPIIPGAGHLELLKVLGMLLNPQLSMGDHIDRAVSSCSSSKFALRTLRSHGLRYQELHLVARATTVASLQYASLAWLGMPPKSSGTGWSVF